MNIITSTATMPNDKNPRNSDINAQKRDILQLQSVYDGVPNSRRGKSAMVVSIVIFFVYIYGQL